MKPETKSTRIALLEAEIAKLKQERDALKPWNSVGPWRSELEGDYWVVRGRFGDMLCSSPYDHATRDADSANFHLFALSERMYRFLEDIAPLLESLNDDHVADDEINELRKILALAKGEEP